MSTAEGGRTAPAAAAPAPSAPPAAAAPTPLLQRDVPRLLLLRQRVHGHFSKHRRMPRCTRQAYALDTVDTKHGLPRFPISVFSSLDTFLPQNATVRSVVLLRTRLHSV